MKGYFKITRGQMKNRIAFQGPKLQVVDIAVS